MNETKSKNFTIAIAVLAVLTLVGVGTWIYQLINGLGVTGMNNGTSWGAYIICFMFFVGLSAGGLIVASSASVFHIAEYKKVALPAIITSLCCIVAAGLFVCIDLGGFYRVYQLIIHPNPTSPLFWDVCVITCYLVLNILYLVFMCSKHADPHKVEIVSRFALPIAILVHSVTAWIFGLQIAKEGWYTAIMAPLFVASAMDSGLALLMMVLAGLRKAKLVDVSQKLFGNLAGLLATCIAVDGFFIGCEILTTVYPGTESGMALFAQMTSGATAPFFWFEVVCGIIIPFCILVFAKNRQKTGLVVLASAGVVLGVLCKRIWLLLTSFISFNVTGAPGVITGSTAASNATGTGVWAVVSSYAPTWVEFVVIIGVISLCSLVFLLLSRKLLGNAKAKRAAVASSSAEPTSL